MSDSPSVDRAAPSDAGLRVIITYKLAKAIAWPLLSAALFVAIHDGLSGDLRDAILRVQAHLTWHWSIDLADWALTATSRKHLIYATAALLADGVVSAVEAWALHTRKPWGEWLVVFSTGALLPFEVVAILREPRVGRFVVLLINLAVVSYLAWRLRAEQIAKGR